MADTEKDVNRAAAAPQEEASAAQAAPFYGVNHAHRGLRHRSLKRRMQKRRKKRKSIQKARRMPSWPH